MKPEKVLSPIDRERLAGDDTSESHGIAGAIPVCCWLAGPALAVTN
jgi:hypothetical protein